MNVAMPQTWTAERFLAWAATREERYEFDGTRPVAMVGGTARHNWITLNIHAALRARLRNTGCRAFGPDLGLRTIGEAVRYPDALITCASFSDSERLAPDVVVVFEVLSAESGRRDRIEKLREYAAVPSIRRYVIVESNSPGLLVLHRPEPAEAWTALPLTGDDILPVPEVTIEIPVAEFYQGVEFPESA